MPIIMTLNRDSIYYDSIPRTRFQESLYYCTAQNVTRTQQLHKTSAFFPPSFFSQHSRERCCNYPTQICVLGHLHHNFLKQYDNGYKLSKFIASVLDNIYSYIYRFTMILDTKTSRTLSMDGLTFLSFLNQYGCGSID